MIGGWDENDTSKSIFMYDPAKDKCDFLARLPKRVEGHSIVKIDNYAFIIGGFDSFGVTDRIMRLNLNTMEAQVLQTKLY